MVSGMDWYWIWGADTGNMTELLAKAGYDMIGADNAEEMLEIAMEKRVGIRS